MRPDKYLQCILKVKGHLSLKERGGSPEYGMQLPNSYTTPIA